MAGASSLAQFNSADKDKGFETIEIDSPPYVMGLGLTQGAVVRVFPTLAADFTLVLACTLRWRSVSCTTCRWPNLSARSRSLRTTGRSSCIVLLLLLHIARRAKGAGFIEPQEIHLGDIEDTLLGQMPVAKEIDAWVLCCTRVRLQTILRAKVVLDSVSKHRAKPMRSCPRRKLKCTSHPNSGTPPPPHLKSPRLQPPST